MIKIIADASLKDLPLFFPPPFHLSYYDSVETLKSMLPLQDVLLCRSTLKVSASLIDPTQLQCIATASSGIDHIDEQLQITLFDAKGANATSVADYVMASIIWLEKQHRLQGTKVGIIGVGAVGSAVMKRLLAMGYDVIGHDPYLELHNLDAITQCDVICIHPHLHTSSPYPSKNLIDAAFLARLKPHVVLINASRGGVVNESALLTAPIPITYCTDVYLDEPNISPQIIDYATLCTPHIAGHSIEAKQNALMVLIRKLHQHFNLPSPLFAMMTESPTPYFCEKKTRTKILTHYNPLIDTTILKSHPDKKLAFLTQRNAHINRHDFAYYDQECYT